VLLVVQLSTYLSREVQSIPRHGSTGTSIAVQPVVHRYEMKPENTAPPAARCRVTKSIPAFFGTVVLHIPSMINLGEN
jgi:hypothetical protein